MRRTRIAVVHPFCTHYTGGLFEILARRFSARFFFFSDGEESYWQREHGVRSGGFPHEYLRGFRLGGTRITPSLPWKLLRAPADAIVSSIDGKFSLPVSYAAARAKRVPIILWTGLWRRLDTPIHRLLFPLTRHAYRHADAIIAYGEHVKRYLISEGVQQDRIFVETHSVDNTFYSRNVPEAEKLSLRVKLGIRPEQKVILYLGRLEEVKGIQYLIEAFALSAIRDAVLVIAGQGSERASLEGLVEKRHVQDKVRFAGYVSVDGTVPYYSIANVYVLPSVTVSEGRETWGLVVNEAFNQGVPVIATDAVGAAAGGFVRDGYNGLVVAERDSNALSEALVKVLEDDALRHMLSNGARATVALHNHERMADGFDAAIEYACRRPQVAAAPQHSSENPESVEAVKNVFCPVCQSDAKLLWPSPKFVRCRGCGLLFRHPLPAPELLHELYETSWQDPQEHRTETGGTDLDLARIYAHRLASSLGRRNFEGLVMLEYGAGRGEFSRALQEMGAAVFAVEPYGCEYLNKQGITAFHRLEELPVNLHFDGIVTQDVIEHLSAPKDVLAACRTRLKPGGWIFVATPNVEGLNARITRARWREACKPGHLLLFAPATLREALRRSGFLRPERLRWLVPYSKSFARRSQNCLLQLLRLDGELRFLAFRE